MFNDKTRKYNIICIICGFLLFRNVLANSTAVNIVDSIALSNITTMPPENNSNKAQNDIDQLPIELTTLSMDSTVLPTSPWISPTEHNETVDVPSHSKDGSLPFSNSSTLSVIPLGKSITLSQNKYKKNMSSSGNEVYVKQKSDETMPIVVFDHLAQINGVDSSFTNKKDEAILNYATEISMGKNEYTESISVTSDSDKPEPSSTPTVKYLENLDNNQSDQTESYNEDNQIVKTNITTAFPEKESKTFAEESSVKDAYTKEFNSVTLNSRPPTVTSSDEQESTEIPEKNELNSLQYERTTVYYSDLSKGRSMNSFPQQSDNGKIEKQISKSKSLLNEFRPSVNGSDINPIDIKNTSLQFATARKHDEWKENKPTRSNISMDLSDVSINSDDEDDSNSQIEHPENEQFQFEDTNNNYNDSQETHDEIVPTDMSASVVSEPECLEEGRMFKSGETFQRNCDESCTCNRGEWVCHSLCDDLFNQHKNMGDLNCHEIRSDDNECCARMECADNTTTNSIAFNDSNDPTPVLHMIPQECQFNGAVYKFRERLEIGCDQICHCDSGGKMNCRARCDQQNHTRLEKCVLIKDPKDVCCQLELCDVTLDDHEQTSSHATSYISNNNLTIPINEDQEQDNTCLFKNTTYKIGDQIHDDCNALCLCTKDGLHCVKLECPSNFGLDVLDPYCLHWETEPKAFRAIAPKCCPERMRCVNNGTCEYKNQQFDNWSAIPTNLTGCEKHCYCENGKVECSAACPPVLALPPSDLPCHHSLARLESLPEDECCKHWACAATQAIVPHDSANDFMENNVQSKLEVIILEAIDAHSVRIVFTVPQVYVNLHGRVEIRYTKTNNNNTSTWETQMFAPPEDLIATSQLEFELPNLEPNSLYYIKITLILRDLNFQPSSQIYNVKTASERMITPPSPIAVYKSDIIAILKNFKSSDMSINNSSSTSLQITWNKLSEEMLELIDGIILKHKKLTENTYTSSPILHRTVTRYNITDLHPDTSYEIDLYFIPVQGEGEEVKIGDTIRAHTLTNVDEFAFNVNVNVTKVTSALVEFSWSGIPYPEDKYVNIYRAKIHSESGSEDSSVFKVLKRNSNSGELISDLKPDTKYNLWLEMYLTNGNVRKSNVVSFITKPGYSTTPAPKGKINAASIETVSDNDYYGALVVVSLIAAVAVMAIFILLLLLTRRRGHQTASINPPRKNDGAFDNPTYKVDVQQETMNL